MIGEEKWATGGVARRAWSTLVQMGALILEDLIISVMLWLALYAFHWVTETFKIEGWAGNVFKEFHSLAGVAAGLLFGVLFIIDLWAVKGERKGIRA